MSFSEGAKSNCLEQIPDKRAGGGRGGGKHTLLLSKHLEMYVLVFLLSKTFPCTFHFSGLSLDVIYQESIL